MRQSIVLYWSRFHKNHLERKKIRFVSWFDSVFPGKYCWAECVSWAFNCYNLNPFTIERSKGCKQESIDHEHKMCYCGGWQGGKCWALLTDEQQNKIKKERSGVSHEDLPF